MTVVQIAGALLLVLGCLVTSLGAIGLFRFPNVYLRLHASTKATSGGALLVVAGLILWSWPSVFAPRLLLILFIVLTATPVANQAIARAAHAHRAGRMVAFSAHTIDQGVRRGWL